jgi:hypothetical protein
MVPLAIGTESELFDDLSRADLAALSRVLTKLTARLETIARSEPGNAG